MPREEAQHGSLDLLPDSELARLVESLNSLHDGELGVSMLAACGPRAVEPLRRFLIHGPPSVVYQPRQRAVRALAELRAKDALLEYLRTPREIPDHAVRFGEEAVLSTAARALAQWKTEDVYEGLLEVVQRAMLPGVLEALGSFGRPEVVPYLIAALGDDLCRRIAEEALRAMGEAAKPALIEAARSPDPSRQHETPSSLLRRRSALRILKAVGVGEGNWPRLRALLEDSDCEIPVTAGEIAMKIAPAHEKDLAVQRMIAALPRADWLMQGEIEECLLEHFAVAGPWIEERLAACYTIPDADFPNQALAVLLNVLRQAGRQR